jgi:hypothetical protein
VLATIPSDVQTVKDIVNFVGSGDMMMGVQNAPEGQRRNISRPMGDSGFDKLASAFDLQTPNHDLRPSLRLPRKA